MKKTLFLTALLGVAFSANALAGTATLTDQTTTIDGTTYSGYVFELTGTNAGGGTDFHKAVFTTPTATTNQSNTATVTNTSGANTKVTYTDNNSTSYSNIDIYQLFADSENQSVANRTYGHTLKLNSSGTDAVTYDTSFTPVTLGGLISTGSAASYTISNSGTRQLEFKGNGSVNATVGVTTTFATGGDVTVQSDSTWTVASGATFTVNSGKDITVSEGKTLTLSGAGNVTIGRIINAGGTIDASALTGTLTFVATRSVSDSTAGTTTKLVKFASADAAKAWLDSETSVAKTYSTYGTLTTDAEWIVYSVRAARTDLAITSTSGQLMATVNSSNDTALYNTISGDKITMSSDKTGWVNTANSTIAADIALADYTLNINDGSSNGPRVTFTGDLTGSSKSKLALGKNWTYNFDLNGDISGFSGTIEDTVGTLNVSIGGSSTTGFAGKIDIAGTLTLNRAVTLTQDGNSLGNVSGTKALTVQGNTTIGGTLGNVGVNISVENNKTLTMTGAGGFGNYVGTITVAQGSTLAIAPSSQENYNILNGSSGKVVNNGTLTINDKVTGDAHINNVSGTGSISSAATTLQVSIDNTSGKSFTGSLEATAGTLTVVNGTSTAFTALSANGGDIVLDAANISATTVTLNGGSITLGTEEAHDYSMTITNLMVKADSDLYGNLVLSDGATVTIADGATVTLGCTIKLSGTTSFVVTTPVTDDPTTWVTVADSVEDVLNASGDSVTDTWAQSQGADKWYTYLSYDAATGTYITTDTVGNLMLVYDKTDSDNGKLMLTPEPATATLSLLALAGLAARRRRK